MPEATCRGSCLLGVSLPRDPTRHEQGTTGILPARFGDAGRTDPAGSSGRLRAGSFGDRVSALVLVESGKDEGRESLDGGLGVRTARLQFQPSPTLGGQRRQVEYALAVELVSI